MALDSDTQPDFGTYAVGRSLWYKNRLNAGRNDPHKQTDGCSMSCGNVRVTLSRINEAVWPSCCR